MKILLLSAYDAGSHSYWRKALVAQFPEHQWQVLTLPPRYFSWRIRGNSLSWALGERSVLEQPYDLIVATSMTDLSALKGLVPALAATPTLVYFHENQFAYPASGREYGSVEPCILNLYTALAADRVAFNSRYNRDSFLRGVAALLKKLPDQVPDGVVERIRERSSVVPVPLPNRLLSDTSLPVIAWESEAPAAKRPLRIVWAARWEFDKGPDRLLAIAQALDARGVDFRLCVLGERFRNTPAEFDQLHQRFAHRIDQFGFAPSREAYLAWLQAADIVLSTAVHEFQGLSVLEAVALGCVPVLPDRQVYPELFGEDYLYADCGGDIEREAQGAVDMILRQAAALRQATAVVPDCNAFRWQTLRAKYERTLTGVRAGQHA